MAVRWLWWSVVLCLTWLGTLRGVTMLGFTLFPLLIIPSAVATILIGMRLRSYWWAVSPPVIIFVLTTASAMQYPDAEMFLGWIIVPLIFTSLFFGVVAASGVWWGIRREEELVF